MNQIAQSVAVTPKLVVPAPVSVMSHRKARILAGLKDLHDENGNRALVRMDDLIAHIAKRFDKSYSGLRPRISVRFDGAIMSLALSKYIKCGKDNRMIFLTEEGERLLSYLLAARPELFEPTTSSNIQKTS